MLIWLICKYEKLDNLSVEQLTESGEKDIGQKLEYIKVFGTNSNQDI